MKKLLFIVSVLLIAGTTWAGAPQPVIPTDGTTGLHHEFNDLNVTHGYDYLLTGGHDWTFSGGKGTNPTENNQTPQWGTVNINGGDITPMSSDEDWVCQFVVRYLATAHVAKLWEFGGGPGGILQVDLWDNGNLRLLHGGEFGNEWTVSEDHGVWWDNPAEWHTFTLHYKAATQLIDVWSDDNLIVDDKPMKDGADGTWWHNRPRGPIEYDSYIIGPLLPEPVTLTLLGLGGLALIKRRK